jgi:D-sedoheptulose 7-phosphate isomerase
VGKFSKTWFEAALRSINDDAVYKAAEVMAEALGKGGNVFVMGNGGSLATAEHFASDVVKGIQRVNSYLGQVHSLGSNQVLFSAIANDEGYDKVFVQQLVAMHLTAEDVIVTFSVSGNSPNIVAAQDYAQHTNAQVVEIVGYRQNEPHVALPDFNVHRITVTTPLTADDHFAAVESMFSCLGHMIARLIAKERE